MVRIDGLGSPGLPPTVLPGGNAFDEIAARASLNIESRKKSVADRMKEIEQLKAEMAEADESDDAGDDAAAEDDSERNQRSNE
jgi:hypothetical protein